MTMATILATIPGTIFVSGGYLARLEDLEKQCGPSLRDLGLGSHTPLVLCSSSLPPEKQQNKVRLSVSKQVPWLNQGGASITHQTCTHNLSTSLPLLNPCLICLILKDDSRHNTYRDISINLYIHNHFRSQSIEKGEMK